MTEGIPIYLEPAETPYFDVSDFDDLESYEDALSPTTLANWKERVFDLIVAADKTLQS